MTDEDQGVFADPITIAEAASLLGVHKNTIRHRIKQGVYQSGRVLTPNGEAYVVSRAAIEVEAAQEPTRPSNAVVPSPMLQEMPPTDLAALLQPYQEQLAEKNARLEQIAGELGIERGRREAMERELAWLRRPWWRRWMGL